MVHPVPPVPRKDYSNHIEKKNLEDDLETPQIHIWKKFLHTQRYIFIVLLSLHQLSFVLFFLCLSFISASLHILNVIC